MNARRFEDDPEIQAQLRERSVRMGILRSAVLWTPFLVVAFGAFLFFLYHQLWGDGRGTIFLLVVLAFLSFLFGAQALQAIADLLGKPKEMTGDVTRRWSRSDSLVVKTHYVRVGKTILRGDRMLLETIKAGDRVRVRYYPNSAIAIGVEKLPLEEPQEAPAR